MANLNIQLSGALQVYDITSGSVNIVNRAIALTYQATVQYFNAYEQLTGTVVLNLPATTVYVVSIINKTPSTNLTLAFTPVGASAGSKILTPGEQFIDFPIAGSSGGYSALSLTPASGTGIAEVLLAA